MADPKKPYIEWVNNRISRDITYHNHKETMAWLATAFYIPSIMWLGYNIGDAGLSCAIRLVITIIILFAFIILLCCFIYTQLTERWRAAERIQMLTKIELDWLKSTDTAEIERLFQNISLAVDIAWPQSIAEELKRRYRQRYSACDTRLKTELTTYAMIIGATAVAISLVWVIKPVCFI
ncbi:MAG: hypothetical protein WC566_03240 [Dehalococcoidia bacterium]